METTMTSNETAGSGRRIAWLVLLLIAAPGARVAPATAQTGQSRLVGKVTNGATGQPLAGVHVAIEGTSLGALTDANGRYAIARVPAGEVTVRARPLGYAEVVRSVTVEGEQTVADFALAEEALSLDALVVTGTAGQARQREVGNTIAQINIAKVDEPVATVDQLLQGRATSVTVTPPGGSFGAGAAIRLRGNVSVSLSNQPLIFVDGVRQTAESYPLNASSANFPHYGPGAVMSPLNDINPADIERIEIVKGPAAATLYGSEASAGVIQIFTKKGAQGRPSWTFQTDHSADWVQPFGSAQRPYLNLDPWLKTAYGTKNSLSVRGGLTDLRYFVSGAFDTGDGVLPNDHEKRLAFRTNLDLQAHEKLALGFTFAYTDHELDITHTGNSGMGLPLNAFRQPNNSFGSDDPEVLSQLLDAEIAQENERLTLGFTATWNPASTFSHRFTVGVDRVSTVQRQYRPFGFALEPVGAISDIRWQSRTVTADYTGSLQWLAKDAFTSTFAWGGQTISTEDNTVDTYGRGFPGPGRQTMSSVAERFVSGGQFRIVSGGFFLQNLIGFRDRVFLTTGARVDGTSTFGSNLGLQVYPKASASWVISEESFWPEPLGTVKLRAAYGHAGRAPGAFDAVRTWQPGSFGGESSFIPGNIGNPDLGPEKTREIEVGFDASWLNDRLTAEFTYYNQLTRDALFNIPQIPSLGFGGSQLENVGRLTNQGIEVAVNGTLLARDGYVWQLGATVATNRSEVLDVGSATSSTIQVGHPAPVVRGILVQNADAYADPVLVKDHFFGPSVPTHTLGINTSIDFPRGFRLTARGEYQGGHYITDNASYFMVDRGNGAPFCDNAYEIAPYGALADVDVSELTALERARCYKHQDLAAGLWVYPADFFKVREITLLVPVGALVPHARNASLTFSLRNAIRWTNEDFPAFDPEMVSSRSNVSALTGGITEHAPSPARFVTSLRVSF